jgi:hypothetical protein
MNQANTIIESAAPPLVISPGREPVIAIMMVLFLALLAAFSIYRQNPPAVVDTNSPLPDFSAARAMKYLEVIGQRPHPIGSTEHAAVRDYIVNELNAQGLHPEVQTATGINPAWKGEFRAGTVENVVARLPGTANTKAVMLVGHYDSVPNGFGASDDGAAVAALLETLRALKSSSALKNDVIFLFTDGEEAGLLGAYAFANEHPWAKDVGLVMNFEARGNHGPSIMFETSGQNGWLINEFAASAPHPVAHSLAYEIYRLLPNDTDFTVFKKSLPGLNFAYIDGITHYHTALDTVAAVDQRSLQHHGSTALALARHFGNLDLQATRSRNSVYFDLLGLTVVHYSGALILPLTIITTLAFVALLIYGLRKKRLRISELIWGFVALLASVAVASLAVKLLWDLVLRFQDVAGVRSQGEAYESDLFFISFVALALAITSALYIFFRKRATIENLTAGALLVWLILLWLASLLLPGASYLPAWLLLFNLLPLAYLLLAKEPDVKSTHFVVLLLLCAVPGLVLLVPLIFQTYIGVTLRLAGGVIAMMILLIGLLLPHLKLVAAPRKWLMPAAMLVIAVGFLGAGIFASQYDAQQPRLDTMFYGLNAETQTSVWASPDSRPDEWIVKFLRSGPNKLSVGALPEFFGAQYDRRFAMVQTETLPLAAPQLSMVSDKTADGVRTVVLRVSSSRQAPVVTIYIDSAADVQAFAVNGRKVDSVPPGRSRSAWNLRYHGLPAGGVELAMDLKTQQPLKLRVVDQSYGLPTLSDKPPAPRPAGLIPSTYPFNDSTLVTKSFVF